MFAWWMLDRPIGSFALVCLAMQGQGSEDRTPVAQHADSRLPGDCDDRESAPLLLKRPPGWRAPEELQGWPASGAAVSEDVLRRYRCYAAELAALADCTVAAAPVDQPSSASALSTLV